MDRKDGTCRSQSDSESVSQSVRLGVQPLRDSLPNFGYSQDRCGFCLSWGVHLDEGTGLLHNKSQSLFVSSDICICTFSVFMNICFNFFFHSFFCFVFAFKYIVSVSPRFVQQIMRNANLLPKDVTTLVLPYVTNTFS
jgi:hypothetical protein